MKLDEKGMTEFFRMIAEDTKEFCEDGKSVIKDVTPIGVTGDLVSAWETAYEIDDKKGHIHCRIQNTMHYAVWQENGTDPFGAPLIPIRLSKLYQKILKDIGGRLHRDRQTGQILAPIWFKDWGPKVRKGPPRDKWTKDPWRNPAVNYKRSWDLWFKIKKSGITAKHFTARGVEIMRQKKSLYPLAHSTGAKIEVSV